MSIPDRFYRIARHKLGEIKDWFDKVDEEEGEATGANRRAAPHHDASQELSDALTPSGASTSGNTRGSSPGIPVNAPRTPQEIARSARTGTSGSSGYGVSGSGTSGPSSGGTTSGYASQPDPLDYHYKLLGLESGADFAAVQAAYNKLAARSDPARFAAGSSDEQAARQIRQRLDASYRALREALDTTAARFGLLEFDEEPKDRQ